MDWARYGEPLTLCSDISSFSASPPSSHVLLVIVGILVIEGGDKHIWRFGVFIYASAEGDKGLVMKVNAVPRTHPTFDCEGIMLL